MSALFDLFGEKKKQSKRILVMGEWLEANLHITDAPEEIAIGTQKNACD